MSLNQRVLLIRNTLNISQKNFAQKIGIKQNTLCCIEKNISKVTNHLIITICAIFKVNESWLRTGEGDMFIKYNKTFEEFSSIFNNLEPKLQKFLLDCAKQLLDIQNSKE